jgi:hypothetical protein
MGGSGLDKFGSGYGPVVGSSEHSNETLVFVKVKKFLEQLSDFFSIALLH